MVNISKAIGGVIGFVVITLLVVILLPVAMNEVRDATDANLSTAAIEDTNISSGGSVLLRNIDIFAAIGLVFFGLGVAGIAVGKKVGAFG